MYLQLFFDCRLNNTDNQHYIKGIFGLEFVFPNKFNLLSFIITNSNIQIFSKDNNFCSKKQYLTYIERD